MAVMSTSSTIPSTTTSPLVTDGTLLLLREFRHDAAVAVGVLGIILNSLVLVGFSTSGNRIVPSVSARRIIINQSVIDFTLSVFLIVSQYRSSYVTPYIPHTGVGPSPETYCRVLWSGYLVWALIDASCYNLNLLTLDRYLSLCHPRTHRTCTSNTRTLAAPVTFIWVAGFSFASANIVFTQYLPSDRSCRWYSERTPGLLFSIAHAHLALFLPVAIMIFCYVKMFRVLSVRLSAENDESGREATRRARAFIVTCMFTCIGYFVCFSLNTIWFLLSSTGLYYLDFRNTWYHLSIIMAFANCFINPVIYLIRLAAFRQHLIHLARCRNRVTRSDRRGADTSSDEEATTVAMSLPSAPETSASTAADTGAAQTQTFLATGASSQ